MINITEKERKLIELLRLDLTYEEMSKILYRSVATIKKEAWNLRVKTGCRSTRRLVAWSYENEINSQRLPNEVRKTG